MIIIPFVLYNACLLVGRLFVLFGCGLIYAFVGATILQITRIAIDIIYNCCILVKKNVFVFLYVFYAILFIDIVNILLYQVQKELVNDYGYHM